MRTLEQKNQRDTRHMTISQDSRNQQYYDRHALSLEIDEQKELDDGDIRQ